MDNWFCRYSSLPWNGYLSKTGLLQLLKGDFKLSIPIVCMQKCVAWGRPRIVHVLNSGKSSECHAVPLAHLLRTLSENHTTRPTTHELWVFDCVVTTTVHLQMNASQKMGDGANIPKPHYLWLTDPCKTHLTLKTTPGLRCAQTCDPTEL